MKKEEMKNVKGGFNPAFAVSDNIGTNDVYPYKAVKCTPPPYTNETCFRCLTVFVPFD